MKVKELIRILKTTNQERNVCVASDEEWNSVFKDIRLQLDDKNNVVLFGLSGSEIDG